ncbi:hypothetical protein ACLOJK_037247 [Asimina triloba]
MPIGQSTRPNEADEVKILIPTSSASSDCTGQVLCSSSSLTTAASHPLHYHLISDPNPASSSSKASGLKPIISKFWQRQIIDAALLLDSSRQPFSIKFGNSNSDVCDVLCSSSSSPSISSNMCRSESLADPVHNRHDIL